MAEEVKLGSSKPMIATQEEMVKAWVPIPCRDECAHLLIPLNKRHACEKCEYELVMECMLPMQKICKLKEKKKTAKLQGKSPIPASPPPPTPDIVSSFFSYLLRGTGNS